MVRPLPDVSIIEQLAEEYQGKARIGKLNVDEQGQTAMRYQVRGIPTMLLFKGGQYWWRRRWARRIPHHAGRKPGGTLEKPFWSCSSRRGQGSELHLVSEAAQIPE